RGWIVKPELLLDGVLGVRQDWEVGAQPNAECPILLGGIDADCDELAVGDSELLLVLDHATQLRHTFSSVPASVKQYGEWLLAARDLRQSNNCAGVVRKRQVGKLAADD